MGSLPQTTGKKKASCSSWCSQSSVSNRNQPNVIITSLWAGFLKGNKQPTSVTIWKRNPGRYQGSWQTPPSSTRTSLKRPALKSAFRYCEHAYTIREKITQLWLPTHLNFPLLLFDKRRPNPLRDCSEAVRSHRESTFSSGCYYGNTANRKNNGQRKKILIIQPRGLKHLWLKAKRRKGN